MRRILLKLRIFLSRLRYPNISTTSRIGRGVFVKNRFNLEMAEDTNIDAGAFILNSRAKFVIKKHSGAAVGLLVVTGNHMSVAGLHLKQVNNKIKDSLDTNHEMDKDIIVEEDVWIASHVTLLVGTVLGRGCEVGAGSVVRSKIPPYAIVVGNPCKVVGFRFTPEEIIKHEQVLYAENERLPIELIYKNYEKFFLSRIKDIKQFTKI